MSEPAIRRSQQHASKQKQIPDESYGIDIVAKQRNAASTQKGRLFGVLVRDAFISVFVISFIFACFIKRQSLKEQYDALDAEAQMLQEHLDNEKAKELLFRLEGAYNQTIDYKERDIRARLGLVYPGEYLVLIEQDDRGMALEENTNTTQKGDLK